jgi:hypothetical protein
MLFDILGMTAGGDPECGAVRAKAVGIGIGGPTVKLQPKVKYSCFIAR